MSLAYEMLITRILVLVEVDLIYESLILLEWNHYFDTKTLSKMDIVNVNDIWQHERVVMRM